MDFETTRARSNRFHFRVTTLRRGLIVPLALAAISLGAFAQENPPAPPPDDTQQNLADTGAMPTPSASTTRAVRLSDVEGKVQIFYGEKQSFDQAQRNMPVEEGMRIVTAEDGRAEVQFEDGSVARVTPNSSLTISQLDESGTVIDANSGLTYYELNGESGKYSVRYSSFTIAPKDGTMFRVNLDADPSELAVMQGSAHVSDAHSLSLDLQANHSVHLDGNGRYQMADSIAPDTWDQWSSDRDQALAAMEQNATTARADTGNPDDPGWNDLDYYGDWYNVPGYGMAWAPSGVDTSFDPYGQGAWGYYPSLGYTWISSYPWGWLPYHCGAWNWFDSYGWMWFPGNCGAAGYGGGWYAYSTVWRTPPGYRLPIRPRFSPTHGGPPHFRVNGPDRNTDTRLIAVNRGVDMSQQFRSVGDARPVARVFSYQGNDIRPAAPVLHPAHPGPLGEQYSQTVQREHPVIPRPAGPMNGFTGGVQNGVHNNVAPYRSISPIQPRSGYVPPRGSVSSPPPRIAVPPSVRSSPPPAPHFSAPPPPAPHMSAPSGGHPR
ncbi:DUF6600 domain-containing protein [Silvibacterium acidisoli]|uniref:DUF6600 domain-containing protein n=1 Tax=Acidobacteriaceae bacterium ZG23-2 TaxID=2883246 RepID=UPI00406C37BC